MLDDRSEGETWQERERTDQQHDADQQRSGPCVGSVPGPSGTTFFRPTEPAIASIVTAGT